MRGEGAEAAIVTDVPDVFGLPFLHAEHLLRFVSLSSVHRSQLQGMVIYNATKKERDKRNTSTKVVLFLGYQAAATFLSGVHKSMSAWLLASIVPIVLAFRTNFKVASLMVVLTAALLYASSLNEEEDDGPDRRDERHGERVREHRPPSHVPAARRVPSPSSATWIVAPEA